MQDRAVRLLSADDIAGAHKQRVHPLQAVTGPSLSGGVLSGDGRGKYGDVYIPIPAVTNNKSSGLQNLLPEFLRPNRFVVGIVDEPPPAAGGEEGITLCLGTNSTGGKLPIFSKQSLDAVFQSLPHPGIEGRSAILQQIEKVRRRFVVQVIHVSLQVPDVFRCAHSVVCSFALIRSHLYGPQGKNGDPTFGLIAGTPLASLPANRRITGGFAGVGTGH